jgi:hypothetical protein
MSAGKILLIGGLAIGIGALVLSSNAHAQPASRLPRGWDPPEGSEHTTLPAGTMGLAMPVERFQWHQDASGGATPGLFTMLSAGPDDWIVLFTPDGTSQVNPIQMGSGSQSRAIGHAAGVTGL